METPADQNTNDPVLRGAPTPLMQLVDAAVAGRAKPKLAVLEHVTWTVRSGEFWVVGGRAGTGKSQLLTTAAGLLPPLRGEHRLLACERTEAADGPPPVLGQHAGFVFSDGGRLFGHLTVAQNVGLPLCYHRDCPLDVVRARVETLLEVVDLLAVANAAPNQLNRAQRQRAALARALALDPELVFLDNPLSGVGAWQSRWWQRFLTQLAAGTALPDRAPFTLVVATDDLRPWLEVARQFALVHDGRWETLGDAAAVRASSDGRVRELLAEAPSKL